jgi:hypothetical protein
MFLAQQRLNAQLSMNFISQHATAITVSAAYVTFAAVTSMRQPRDSFYDWFYRFTHALLPLAEHVIERKPLNGNGNGGAAPVPPPPQK